MSQSGITYPTRSGFFPINQSGICEAKKSGLFPDRHSTSIDLLFLPVALACFALLLRAQAATPELLPAPPPDGFYNGFNTAEGFGALFALTTGTFNTALGFKALNADELRRGARELLLGTQT